MSADLHPPPLVSTLSARLEPTSLSSNVIRDISPNDAMYKHAAIAHGGQALDMYLQWGAQALRAVLLAILATNGAVPKTILDFGCGHGRVLRMFRSEFPQAELAACDIDRDGVDYCSEAFDARPIYSTDNPEELDIRGEFDLIWCGSVFTHHSAERWNQLLKVLISKITSSGLLIFSTLSRRVKQLVENGELDFGLTDEAVANLLATYSREGFAYQPYPVDTSGLSSYGISLSSPAWVLRTLTSQSPITDVIYMESACGNQDVFSCRRSPA